MEFSATKASFPVSVVATIHHSTAVLMDFSATKASCPVSVVATIHQSTAVLMEFSATKASFPVLVVATIHHSTAVLVVNFLKSEMTESLYFMLSDFNKGGLFYTMRLPANLKRTI
jgi:adenosine/AMP kinase